MTALSISAPFPTFNDTDGEPLENGYIYIGTANQNPVTSPIAVYWDAALTIPAVQPIRTSGGYPVYNGTPANVYANSDYSIRVTNKNGTLVYSAPATTERLSNVVVSSVDSSKVSYQPSGTGAVATTVQAKLRESVSVKDFGAVGDGSDATAAFVSAAATGKTIFVPKGDYTISSPVTISSWMYGEGADDGQTGIILSSTGQLVVGDEQAWWYGFKLTSSVNSKTFIKCAISYWKLTDFRLEATGGATAQVGIEFDTSARSVYHCDVHNFKFKVDYPVKITGNNTESFNSNRIGASLRDYWQNFISAITVSANSGIACLANEFAGYMETGTNAFVVDDGSFRENRVDVILDAVTRLLNPSVTINEPNFWKVKSETIVIGGGAGVVTNQVWQANKARFRAYLGSADQSIPDQTFTKITFNTETFDETGDFDSTTNYQFTARYPMRLFVKAMADVTTNLADQDRVRLSIYKNSSEWATSSDYTSGTNGARVQVSDIVDLAAGDTVSVWVWANQAAGASGHFVSAGSIFTFISGFEL